MKKTVLIITALLCIFLLTACMLQNKPGKGSKSELLSVIDDDFTEKYITGLDVALTGENELIFDDPELIPSNTLYMFFLYAINAENETGNKWYNKDDLSYRIPASDIKEILTKYFDKNKFNENLIEGYDYQKGVIVTPLISGFGGDRCVKITDKRALSDDTVSVTADFCDFDNTDNIFYTKVYTFQIQGDNVKYLSILKNYDKSKEKISYIGLKYGFIGYCKGDKLYPYYTNDGTNNFSEHKSIGEFLTSVYKTYNDTKKIGEHGLKAEDFNKETYLELQTDFSLRFSSFEEILWISGKINPLPRKVERVSDDKLKDYTEPIEKKLTALGADKSPVNITQAYKADIDNDGKIETIICANSLRKDWELISGEVTSHVEGDYAVSDVNKGHAVYSYIIMEKEGKYYDIYSEALTEGRHNYIDLYFGTEIAGLFDLNGDGNMEICITTIHWDIPDVQIYSQNKTKFNKVLTANFAW